jgi:hypothetical protein
MYGYPSASGSAPVRLSSAQPASDQPLQKIKTAFTASCEMDTTRGAVLSIFMTTIFLCTHLTTLMYGVFFGMGDIQHCHTIGFASSSTLLLLLLLVYPRIPCLLPPGALDIFGVIWMLLFASIHRGRYTQVHGLVPGTALASWAGYFVYILVQTIYHKLPYHIVFYHIIVSRALCSHQSHLCLACCVLVM